MYLTLIVLMINLIKIINYNFFNQGSREFSMGSGQNYPIVLLTKKKKKEFVVEAEVNI